MLLAKKVPYRVGYNPIIELDGAHTDISIGFGVVALNSGDIYIETDVKLERAYLLMDGTVDLEWNKKYVSIRRGSFLDERPYVLHVPSGMAVTIRCTQNGTNVAVVKVTNANKFEAHLYLPEECRSELFGKGTLNETATREARTVFDTTNAPHSEMVIGEIITWPGKWSSYPPHAHRHPEIYHYRFCPTTGFGVSFIGDQPHLTRDGYTTYISGDLTHAQCAAPGYAMYYIWVIRHLPGDPWIRELSTTIEPEHRWMIEPKAHIWNRPAE